MIKIITMSNELDKLIRKSEDVLLPIGQCYAEWSNIGFLEAKSCVNAILTEFNIFLEHDIQVKKFQIIPLEEWFKSEGQNLLDGLRSFARDNHMGLDEMVGTIGKVTVVNRKDEQNREFSTIVNFDPEFDEEFIVSA